MHRLTIDIDDDIAESITRIAGSQQMTPEQTATFLLDRTLFGVARSMQMPLTKYEDYTPQSVLVVTDDSSDHVLKHFRCPNCGNIVFDYYGSTKLIMNGRFDRENMMVDGEEADPAGQQFGIPLVVGCQGRVLVQYANGRTGKVRCASKFYKMKA